MEAESAAPQQLALCKTPQAVDYVMKLWAQLHLNLPNFDIVFT
jgi:hypothetical protein